MLQLDHRILYREGFKLPVFFRDDEGVLYLAGWRPVEMRDLIQFTW